MEIADSSPDPIGYAVFLDKGMQLLRRLAGDQWTDHNTHDPGITILEQLCFALTDLSYRIGFDIEDLMAGNGSSEWTGQFRPALMLSSGPVTLKDWRKVLLDIEGVRNAWIFPLDTSSEEYAPRVFFDPVEDGLWVSPPTLSRDSKLNLEPLHMLGLYRVLFVPEPGQDVEIVQNRIRLALHRRRNLCEDFHQIEGLTARSVQVEGRIDIENVSDPAALLAKIYFVIQEYLSPRIRFYTLQERLQAGDSLEDALEGPLLQYGFLDHDELEAFQVRKSLRISDILRLIMNLKGVKAVRQLRLSLPNSNNFASTEKGEPWELIIPEDFTPVLLIPNFQAANAVPLVGIRLFQDGLPLQIDWGISWRWLKDLNRAEKERTKANLQHTDTLQPAKGRDRKVQQHQSIQHQFPDVYGIGEVGLPRHVSVLRQAQTQQFKAYLTIFDQLLANAFAQLGGVRKLFSLAPGSSKETYFSQSLLGEIPRLEPLIHWRKLGLSEGHPEAEKEANYQRTIQEYAEGGKLDPARQSLWDRRNRLLNHLLARFGEQVVEHDAVLKKNLFAQKETFLAEYERFGKERGKAFDLSRAAWIPENVDNVSGLKRRLSVILGFDDLIRRNLSILPRNDSGGFHMIEHILLRPFSGDKGQKSPVLELSVTDDPDRPPLRDPFSFQLSYIFPNWLDRFDTEKNPGFRKAIAKTLREETPAHIKIFVHWLDKDEMKNFEEAYQSWMNQQKA